MHTIEIPPPVSLSFDIVVRAGEEPTRRLTFAEWLLYVVLEDPRWSERYATQCQRASIERVCRVLEKSGEHGVGVGIESADYKLLREIVESPRYMTPQGPAPGYALPAMGRACFPFIKAVMDAAGE